MSDCDHKWRLMRVPYECPYCLREKVSELEAELAQWKTWGIVEIAVRNPSVMEYIKHWEGRAERADALAALRLEWYAKARADQDRAEAAELHMRQRAIEHVAEVNGWMMRVNALEAERDAAESRLASLADTIASAHRNTEMHGENVNADLREAVWKLSYRANDYRAERDALRALLQRAAPLLKEVVLSHVDPDDPSYNECEKPNSLCAWCEDAQQIIDAMRRCIAAYKDLPVLDGQEDDMSEECENVSTLNEVLVRVRELEAERDANRSRAEANDLRIVELMGDVGDLRAALAATDHLYHDDGSVRTCYEYDDDQKAWEAMAAARAVLKESP